MFKKGQIPWNKGGHHSSESNKKNSLANKGKRRSIATEFGHREYTPWLKGTKGLMKANSGSFKKGQVSINKGRKASLETRQKQRESNLRSKKRVFKDTKIELRVEAELKKRGINYQKQVPLCKIAKVDFYLPEYRIIIQCDGDYWHNLSWQKARDIRQDSILTFNGFNIYRFWEHEINSSVENCINKIIFN